MNKKQKVLTQVMLPVFLFAGFLGVSQDGYASAFTWWFVVGVIYTAIFFLLRPARPNRFIPN